jgi:hypothetical protein
MLRPWWQWAWSGHIPSASARVRAFRKPPRWSPLDLSYTRQHGFPEALERMHDTLRIISSGGSRTTDRQTASTLFWRRTVHSEPCYGTITRALSLVMGSAEMQAPGLRNILGQAAALSVRNGRTGWSGVHHLRGRCTRCATGDTHMSASMLPCEE